MFLQLKLQRDTFAINLKGCDWLSIVFEAVFYFTSKFFHYLAEKLQKLTDSLKMNFFLSVTAAVSEHRHNTPKSFQTAWYNTANYDAAVPFGRES